MPDEVAVKSASGHVKELVEAVRELDMVRAEQVLTRASALLPPHALVTDVMAPTLRRIGEQWAAGKLCVASEHAASALVRDRASGMLRAFATSGAVETVLATTPAGELHELGALLAAVIAATQGYRISYVGPNLPAHEIALAARGSHAGVVLLSVVALDSEAALREVAALAPELGSDTTLVIGGSRAAAIAAKMKGKVVALGNLREFSDWLRQRAALRG
jgi:methanogenic corrinoid protein MtbC1